MTRGARGPELLFRYALGGRATDHPYAAAVLPVSGQLNSNSRIRFSARSAQPMRMSVQLRRPGPSGGDRWRRSVYLDETSRDIVIPLSDMRGVGNAARVDGLAGVDSLLFVVDDVNTTMGFGGRVWISNLTVE